jgi:hypothetical protein
LEVEGPEFAHLVAGDLGLPVEWEAAGGLGCLQGVADLVEARAVGTVGRERVELGLLEALEGALLAEGVLALDLADADAVGKLGTEGAG